MITLSNIPCKQCNNKNYTKGRTKAVKYIVIHYTANNGDTALNNCTYFANNSNCNASAHYFVDENGVHQSVNTSDTAWHCGGTSKYKHSECRNANSIGIEMCSRKKDGLYYIKDETVSNTIELTKALMQKYNIPVSNVIRHYDVWNKQCPEPFVRNGGLWTDFKNRLESEDLTMTQYEELKKENQQLKAQIQALQPQIYNYMDSNMPNWARATIQKLMNKGILVGDEQGRLGLTMDMLKLFVVNDRAGLYN